MNFENKTLQENLNYLKLPTILQNYESTAAQSARTNLSHMEFLNELIAQEAAERLARSVKRRLSQAHLPYNKTLDMFQWHHPQKINRQQIQHLFTLTFIAEKINPVFIALTGLGKTHLAIALAREACRKAHTVLFTTAAEMILKLKAAQQANQLIQELKKYTNPALLLIDQLGYFTIDDHGTELFFQVISNRYERASTILTSNRIFKDWHLIFNNDIMAASAILDRVLHHSEVIIIEGESYRLKDKIILEKSAENPEKI